MQLHYYSRARPRFARVIFARGLLRQIFSIGACQLSGRLCGLSAAGACERFEGVVRCRKKCKRENEREIEGEEGRKNTEIKKERQEEIKSCMEVHGVASELPWRLEAAWVPLGGSFHSATPGSWQCERQPTSKTMRNLDEPCITLAKFFVFPRSLHQHPAMPILAARRRVHCFTGRHVATSI